MKLIDEYLPKHSLSQFVKKIPSDQDMQGRENAPNMTKIESHKAQTAVLAKMSGAFKQQIFDDFSKRHSDIKDKIVEFYKEMKNAFNDSQKNLSDEAF